MWEEAAANTCLLTVKAMDTATNGNLRKTSATVGVWFGTGKSTNGEGLVLPMDKVSGSIHGVDDPRGLLCEVAVFAH